MSSSILRSILNGRDTFACLSNGRRKPLSLLSDQIAIVAARTRKLKSLPSNPFVVVVSPLKALISDQLESCQTLKFKAVKIKLKLFDHDDKLKELEVCFRHALWALRNGSVAKPRSMLNTAIFDPWQRSLFSRQQTAGKEPLLAGKSRRNIWH